jgi:hypothetical protein
VDKAEQTQNKAARSESDTKSRSTLSTERKLLLYQAVLTTGPKHSAVEDSPKFQHRNLAALAIRDSPIHSGTMKTYR